MSDARKNALVRECMRQYESCLYTAASLWIYQRSARRWKTVFVIVPIVFGALAGSDVLGLFGNASTGLSLLFGLLAGVFPAVYSALEFGMREKDIGRAAADFTKLRDEFRTLATVHCNEDYAEFLKLFERTCERKEYIRRDAPNAPEKFFVEAQKKISKGDYSFWVDGGLDPLLNDESE